MKLKIQSFFCAGFLMFFCSSIYSQWISQSTGISGYISSIVFINENTGFAACSNSTILKTTNSGVTWVIKYNTGTPSLFSCSFADDNIGVAVGSFGAIYRTTNTGENWSELPIFGFGNTNYVKFTSSTTGWLSYGDLIYKSTNAGLNWSVTAPIDGSSFLTLSFINNFTGWAPTRQDVISNEGRVYKTTNGGQNWITNILPVSDENIWASFFPDSNYGWLGMDSGIVLRTSNGGVNWIYQNLPITERVNSFYFINSATGYAACGGGLIFKTTNSGNLWSQQNSGSSEFLKSVFFINNTTGWVSGGNGTILKTTTGGSVAIQQISTTIPDKFYLEQNYPNPFNPATVISFQLPAAGFVKLKVFDLLGREIANLVNENLSAGSCKYDFNASALPSGIYFYKLETENFSETKKMVLMK